ncbi:MAG: ATP-dependent RecD-like DNA helicase [Solobacterium sp.]|nr:ATP-dependent RecD-like DNA helicase [Solobacterium sp.]
MNDEVIRITGNVAYILYRNEETGYSVFRFRRTDENERIITVTGIFPVLEKDRQYEILGEYVEHPTYGMQFRMHSYGVPLPTESEGIIRFLSGPQFPGIGRKTAMKIVETLGEDCLDLIRNDPSCLRRVPLSAEKAAMIHEQLMSEDEGMEQLIRFLNIHGIGMRNLVRLNRTYGTQALVKLKENPYRVIEECDGFGFETADKIAMNLGFPHDDERRLYALLVSLTMDLCMQNGDSFLYYDELEEAFCRKCEGLSFDYETLYQTAIRRRSLIEEEDRVYPVTQYDAEAGIASFLRTFPYLLSDPVDETQLEPAILQLQEETGIRYDEDQTEAIRTFFAHPLTIITGGPGTGKTTVVRALTSLYRKLYPGSEVVCTAPTGRAAKRLSELTDQSAMTIHSLLKWDLESNTFGRNEDEPVYADLLIIDEFSMVDAWLFYHLLDACRNVRRICIIGDEDQLPSVSPGCILRDLIDSGMFPLIRLSHIYRQKHESDVIALAHDIRQGTVDFEAYTHDVAFFECPSQDIRYHVASIVRNAMEKGYLLNDIQVLSPMYRGNAGIDLLNNYLQEVFNPEEEGRRQMRFGYTVFREGDKILQLKNQPEDDVFNGDIGILTEIETAQENENGKVTLYVDFDGIIASYTAETISNITLAYCISVHKSQGSEYPIVIMPLTHQHTIMLQKKLIYTGVTRARRSLILLGSKEAFLNGIAHEDRHRRRTTLSQRLCSDTGYVILSEEPQDFA